VKRFIGIVLVLCLLFSPALAKHKKVSFDEQAAWSYIKDLASDSMQGRRSGQPGALMAEEYIASRFKEWGLEPAGDNGTFFQNFTIEHSHVEEGVALEVITDRARRDFYYGEDWRVQRLSGSGHFTTEIVFVGYGIHAPEKGYDDYADVDIKGKIVLFTSGSPRKLEKKLKEEAEMEKRIEAAQKLGARGIIGFKPAQSQAPSFRLRIKKELYKPDFVLITVEDKVVDFIFKDLNTDLRTLFQTIEKTAQPKSLHTGVKAFVSVNAYFDEKRPTRNVLAKISGKDKKLKDEYIIIGAHMDHLGITPMGDVMNGANDNASGTAVVMEIARVMKLNKVKLKRTVIFALWAGEEQGLLGSRHYSDNPTHPIEKTVANLNMDMVGIGSGKINFGGKYYSPEIWKLLEEKLPKELMEAVKPGRGGPGGSDHTAFLQKGVPAYFAITEDSFLKYHHSRDDFDLIQPELLKKTGDFIQTATELLASETVEFIKPMRQETFQFRYQNLINYRLSPLENVISNHGDTKDSHVDLQFSIIKGQESLKGDELRVDILKKFLTYSEKIKESKGLTYYSSSGRLSRDVRQGKTTVITGLKGLDAFIDDPQWANVLAKQGLYFVVLDDPSVLFEQEALSEKGKEIINALDSNGLLLFVKGADASQAKTLLQTSKKPIVLLEKNLPDKEIMELIKQKDSALGLLLQIEDSPEDYFKKLDAVKQSIGTQHLMIVNDVCLWGDTGKELMLKTISEILKAKYERFDLSNIFSSTFLRVLDKARGETPQQRFAFMPF